MKVTVTIIYTLQGTNISPKNGILKMILLFLRWDMLIPWWVTPFFVWLPSYAINYSCFLAFLPQVSSLNALPGLRCTAANLGSVGILKGSSKIWYTADCLTGDSLCTWVVVSKMFYFHPYLGKTPMLTFIVFKWVETTNEAQSRNKAAKNRKHFTKRT